MFYIIAYDISDNRLRKQASKILCAFGNRVQKSVYELEIKPDQLPSLLNRLSTFIEESDSLRCYPLCEGCVERARLCNDEPLARDQLYYLA